MSRFNCQGLITGATHLENKKLVALSGYNGFLQPFIYLLYDFQNTDFFSGNKRKIDLNLPFHQMEAITTTNGLIYYMTNERFQSGSVSIPAKLHQFDLSAFTNTFLQGGSLEIQTLEKTETIQLYPNPTASYITFNLPNPDKSDRYFVELIDMNGQSVLTREIPVSFNKQKIAVSHLTTGTYTFLLKNQRTCYRSTFQVN